MKIRVGSVLYLKDMSDDKRPKLIINAIPNGAYIYYGCEGPTGENYGPYDYAFLNKYYTHSIKRILQRL